MRVSQLFPATVFVALGLAFSPLAQAGEVAQTEDTRLWRAGIDGVEIEWDTNGSVRRIYSQISQPVQFPDKRGIRKAQTIAEEKAKGAIIRWLKQDSFSTRVVTEIDQDLETATRERSGEGDTWSKTNQRQMVENLTEVVGSFAKGSLSGVMILEKGYDEANEEAWVKVGISRKSIKATGEVNDMLNGDGNSAGCTDSTNCGKTSSGSEIEKIQDPDW